MANSDFISFLKTLNPDDWDKKISNTWTLQDLVAHMVGWEKAFIEVAHALAEGKARPWFMDPGTWDAFNAQSVKFYKDYSPHDLMVEWEKWQKELLKTIDHFGEEKLREYPELVDWIFDQSENSHYNSHLRQLKEVLQK